VIVYVVVDEDDHIRDIFSDEKSAVILCNKLTNDYMAYYVQPWEVKNA
jgi:hypothetical protein